MDGLRGLAALVVVLFHYTTQYRKLIDPAAQPWFELNWGHYGVQLFFIISGFVIFMTVNRAKSVWQFAAWRFARLYPVFWVCVAVTFVVTKITPLPGIDLTLRDFVLNLTMVPRAFGATLVDGAYWTLFYEMGFYVLIGGMLAVGLKRYSLWLFAALTVLSVLSAPGLLNLYQGKIANAVAWTPFFLIGMTIYDMRDRVRRYHVLLITVSLLSVALNLWGWSSEGEGINAPSYIILVTVCAGLVYLASRGKLPILSSAPFVFLGTISYSWYLIHQYVGYTIIRETTTMGGHLMVGIVLAFATTMGLACCLTKFIEVPANRWFRQKLVNRKSE